MKSPHPLFVAIFLLLSIISPAALLSSGKDKAWASSYQCGYDVWCPRGQKCVRGKCQRPTVGKVGKVAVHHKPDHEGRRRGAGFRSGFERLPDEEPPKKEEKKRERPKPPVHGRAGNRYKNEKTFAVRIGIVFLVVALPACLRRLVS